MLISNSTTPIGDLYIQKQKEMDMKFKNVIIMMEIGKFYEVYTFETEDGEMGKAKEMSRVCNIVLTRKNKNNAVSMSNPYMCGFPSHSLSRYVQHLVSHSYTVAVYSQTTTVGDKIERGLQGVYSPSVMIGNIEDDNLENTDRCILALSVDKTTLLGKKDDALISVAYVCISTTNGSVCCEENSFLHEHDAVSFIMKVHDIYRPQEILLRSFSDLNDFFQDTAVHTLPEWENDNKKYSELEFQQIVLEKVYTERSTHEISVVEELGLERHPDLVSILTYTISFLEQHHPLAIYRLQQPKFLQHTDNVAYNTQSLYDLDLFSNSHRQKKSLFDILDNTSTPAGKRLLRKTMFAPHYNVSRLTRSYDEISAFIPLLQDLQIKKNVVFYNTDVEHALRKIEMGHVGVLTVFRFLKFLFDFEGLFDRLPPGLQISQEWEAHKEDVNKIHIHVSGKWDMALMQSWRSWETDTIWKQTPPVLIKKQLELDTKECAFKKWVDTSIGPDLFQRLVFTEEEAYISTTKKIYNELKNRDDLRFRLMSSSHRIHHPQIDKYFHERKSILGFIVRMRRQIFQEELEELVGKFGKVLAYMAHTAAYVDMMLSHATSAVRFRLNRPEPTEEPSVLSCGKVRHLVVEAMSPQNDYVANDVGLTSQHGILLFGQNSAGKCFAHNTQMVLWDGRHKPVQDLTLEDTLIGDDGTPRKIMALTRGNGALYDVVRSDTEEVMMNVNEEHILCLTDTDGSNFIEVSIKNILEKPHKYATMMHQYTRCGSPTQTVRGNVIERQYYTNDEEWNKIYLSFLHCGRRVRHHTDQLIIEPSDNNIVAITIRQKTRNGEFFGFGIDGNERFLMPDGTVAHNSTLMKSMGVAVVMAQCGMFVPCETMKWSPFTSLFTKIGSRDNIWKGKSTFTTEMNELKHIMDRSNDRSLILCDELTSGTETFSATGIVASTLEMFLGKKSKFIMTTHLHTLKQFDELMSHSQLRVMHFSMEYHKDEKKLVFDRILRDGSGKSIYGLEIAEYLGFQDEFLKKAFQYRTQLDKNSIEIGPKKRSRYNAKKWVDTCENCGSKSELHTHHIKPQKDATTDGYIGNYHKNRLCNLRVLCRKCHEKEHHDHDTHDKHSIG
jgi:DNA mismatch repair ATPase MutS